MAYSRAYFVLGSAYHNDARHCGKKNWKKYEEKNLGEIKKSAVGA